MDALEFIRERNRMCRRFDKSCDGCPAYENGWYCDSDAWDEKLVTIVEQWSKEHPRKTRQSVFLEQWPNVGLDCRGVIAIDPCDIDTTLYKEGMGCSNGNCEECSRKFWMQEVE